MKLVTLASTAGTLYLFFKSNNKKNNKEIIDIKEEEKKEKNLIGTSIMGIVGGVIMKNTVPIFPLRNGFKGVVIGSGLFLGWKMFNGIIISAIDNAIKKKK